MTERTGYVGNTFGAKRVVERLESFFLQVDAAEIVIHKADQPNTLFDFLDPDRLPGEDVPRLIFLRCRQIRPQWVTNNELGEAKGTPLSARMLAGWPRSLNKLYLQ